MYRVTETNISKFDKLQKYKAHYVIYFQTKKQAEEYIEKSRKLRTGKFIVKLEYTKEIEIPNLSDCEVLNDLTEIMNNIFGLEILRNFEIIEAEEQSLLVKEFRHFRYKEDFDINFDKKYIYLRKNERIKIIVKNNGLNRALLLDEKEEEKQ